MTGAPHSLNAAREAARSRKRRRRIVAASVAGGLLLVLLAAVWVFWYSSLFVVREVEVGGTSLLTRDEVTAAAQVEQGAPLASVDLAAVGARVGSLAPVASVEVSRSFPDRVVIDVTERRLVFVRQSGAAYSWVDPEGIEFHSSTEPPQGVPVALLGSAETRLLADIAEVVSHLPDALAGEAVVLPRPSVDRIELQLPEDRTVVWGSADDSELKSQVLAALLSVEAQVYDVSAPNHPTTR
ncbi:MAG TPA: FtsQ-type POTRA domain-containing protein [Arachnia sp.]|nr:FtsQ-type POTRA domain-containing protein [Arachnia sp.]HMT86341.1 FtsQ-type POTRA domain-containing protein [Arachnia sp.]